VNLNFLLPLADWLFGTMRREATAEERRRWPAFEEAKRLVFPTTRFRPGRDRDSARPQDARGAFR
jgi:hypothetical protein